MSYLVTNPKDRFSGDETQLFSNYLQDSTPICKVAVKVLYTEEDKEQKRTVGIMLVIVLSYSGRF